MIQCPKSNDPLRDEVNCRVNHSPDEIVDVLFLDIDGVLLPFGDSNGDNCNGESEDGSRGLRSSSSQCQSKKNKHSSKNNNKCIFPSEIMKALTSLLHRMSNITVEASPSTSNSRWQSGLDAHSANYVRSNPVLVLSSTWRAQPHFVEDILSNFRAFVDDNTATAAANPNGNYFGNADENNSNDAANYVAHVRRIWQPHLRSFYDIIDPYYHDTRREEILRWLTANLNHNVPAKAANINTFIHMKSANRVFQSSNATNATYSFNLANPTASRMSNTIDSFNGTHDMAVFTRKNAVREQSPLIATHNSITNNQQYHHTQRQITKTNKQGKQNKHNIQNKQAKNSRSRMNEHKKQIKQVKQRQQSTKQRQSKKDQQTKEWKQRNKGYSPRRCIIRSWVALDDEDLISEKKIELEEQHLKDNFRNPPERQKENRQDNESRGPMEGQFVNQDMNVPDNESGDASNTYVETTTMTHSSSASSSSSSTLLSFENHAIQTQSSIGLTINHVDEAIQMVTKQMMDFYKCH